MHMVNKFAVQGDDGDFYVQLEGNFPSNPQTQIGAYEVPFWMMTPKRGTGTNLLVPVCLSASHVAFASTRIEAMLMSMGTAAGVAASQVVLKRRELSKTSTWQLCKIFSWARSTRQSTFNKVFT